MAQGGPPVLSNQFGDIVTANGTSFKRVWSFCTFTKTNQSINLNPRIGIPLQPTAQYGYGIPDFSFSFNSF
jgi:hypothetical protein